MRATRRTFRTAAIATGAIAALAVPTTAAFAADTPPNPPNPQGQVDQDKSTDTDTDAGQDTGQDTGTDTPEPGSWESMGTTDLGKGWAAKVDVNASARTAKAAISLDGAAKGSLTAYEKAASTTIDGNTFTLTPDGTVTAKLKDTTDKDKDKDKPVPGGWVSKGTTDLGKGWSAKVDVNASARTAKAAITLHGKAKGSLKAYVDPQITKIDGNTFKLTADGTITRTGATPKPTPPKPVPGGWVSKGTTDLGKGWAAKVDVNASARTAKAALTHNGKAKGTLKAYINPSTTKIDGNTFKLTADGTITRTGAKQTPPKPQPKPQPHTQQKNGTSQVVPKGGVKAGADGMSPAGDSAPLMAAGGGMAALGAAGLGFALYRRKQND